MRSFSLTILTFLLLAARAPAQENACAGPLAAVPPSKLPTGNGLGYATVSTDGTVTSFLSRPYARIRPIPAATGDDEEDEGYDVEPAVNYLRSARWQIGDENGERVTDYLRESSVVRTRGAGLTQYAFLPFGLRWNALVLVGVPDRKKARGPLLRIQWRHPVAGRSMESTGGATVQIWEFKGMAARVVAIPLGAGGGEARKCAGQNADEQACLTGATGWALLSLEGGAEISLAVAAVKAWLGQTAPARLANRETAQADRARPRNAMCFVSSEEKSLFRQNETTLRMAQIREPNNEHSHAEGLINASLPEGEFAVPYARDMAYAVVSLSRTGHKTSAEKALAAYFHARPVGESRASVRGMDYQISTARYFGNGHEEADRSGYVEQNLELDDWGLVLWAMGEHYRSTARTAWLKQRTYRGTIYESARDYVVKPLLGNLDPTPNGLIVTKDSSVWEQNDEPRRHYPASTIAAISGLRGFLEIARAMRDDRTTREISEKIPQLERGFADAFIRDGDVLGTHKDETSLVKTMAGTAVPHRNDIDGSLLEAINMGVLRDPALARNITQRVERDLKAATGGYRRTNGPTGYERQEFVFIGINLARAYLRLGEPARAETIMQRVRALAAQDSNLIPELYQAECVPGEPDFQKAIGTASGAIPMVGYGAGIYNIYVQERHVLLRAGAAALPGGAPGGDGAAVERARAQCKTDF